MCAFDCASDIRRHLRRQPPALSRGFAPTGFWRGLPLALWLALSLTLSLPTGNAHAEDDKRAVQLREAARSAQAAAQRAQQELAAVKDERDRLIQDDDARRAKLVEAQAQGRATAGQVVGLKVSLAQVSAERERLKADLADVLSGQAALKLQLEKAQAAVMASTQALDEQRRTTQAVSSLLERSVKSLAAAEQANRQLHALGLQAVNAYVQATPEAVRARDEPFLGLAAVTLEDRAEALRRALAEQRVAP